MSIASVTTRPRATVAHRSHGRVRARLERPFHPQHLELIRDRLADHPDVSSVEVNPATGSVLLTGHHADRLHHALAEVVDLIAPVVQGDGLEPGVEAAVNVVKLADYRLRNATGGRFSLRVLVPTTFIAIGIRQLIAEGLSIGAVPWYVLIYYGVDSFLKLYPELGPRTQPVDSRPL